MHERVSFVQRVRSSTGFAGGGPVERERIVLFANDLTYNLLSQWEMTRMQTSSAKSAYAESQCSR
jgi:hypothetical protein